MTWASVPHECTAQPGNRWERVWRDPQRRYRIVYICCCGFLVDFEP